MTRQWLAPASTYATVAVITGIVAATSYEHEYQLAWRHGQPAWVAALLPATADGLILGATVTVLWAARRDLPRKWPTLVLVVGILATVGANLASGLPYGPVGAVVAAWSGVALFLISEVALWLARARQKLAGPVAAACDHPPPPVTASEALTLARAELRRRGEHAGRDTLAARFELSPHRVRALLAEPGENGQGPREDVTA